MRRTAEYRAGAVTHEHEIRHIDRQFPRRIEGMRGRQTRVVSHLLGSLDGGFCGSDTPAFRDEGNQLRIAFRQFLRKRMIRRQRDEARTEQRIGPGGEHFDFGAVRQIEREAHAFRTSDPVLLHELNFFRPPLQAVQRLEKIVAIRGDLEKPLRELAALNGRAGAPAAAVDHLFIGENGLIDRVPVHIGFGAIDEFAFVKFDEQLLLMLVVTRIAGRELSAPVDGQSHRFELFAHRGDVAVGPLERVDALIAGGIFGGQAECIPTHRMQHVEALRAAKTRDDVAHRVVAHMPDVNASGRIGEHLEHVAFGPPRIGARDKALAGGPDRLPVNFGFLGVVARHPRLHPHRLPGAAGGGCGSQGLTARRA